MNAKKCLLRIIVDVEPAKLKEFEQALEGLIQVQNSQVSHSKSIYQSKIDPCRFLYQEECTSTYELKLHIESREFRALMGCFKLLSNIVVSEMINTDKRISVT